METFMKDFMSIYVLESKETMGLYAASCIKNDILSFLLYKEEISILFAAAPSQDEVLKSLLTYSDIPWNKINAYHMDEYVGISSNEPQSFRNYLIRSIFSKRPFRSVNLIDIDKNDIREVQKDYERKLKSNGIDLVILGIGESGHIAFNDPPDAKFNDEQWVRKVILNNTSRMQQVHDGCFSRIEDVPKEALTVTIPAFMSAKSLHCVVPGLSKAEAVKNTVNGEISPMCPASVLRLHHNSHLYLDKKSASKLTI
ncbi:MAG: glucosamine-6-phosphate deaminase [Sphaerochaeta sp.]